MRLDAYLAKEHPEHSRATWAKYIESGFVTKNGKKISRSDLVKANDKVEINLPKLKVKELDLPVIYEDDNVIVINKPAGVLTHSKGAINDEFTVADFVREAGDWSLETRKNTKKHPDSNLKVLGSTRQGIVHRLDRGTSGVIIGAKNEEALKKLQKQFSDRKVKKKYLAIVEKTPKDKEFVIDLPILRNPKYPSQFKVDSKGKPAITNVKLIEKFKDGRALLELSPKTGRTHQLRVHLAYIGSPIVGDIVYGNNKKISRSDLENSERMMLHASELEITLPNSERKIFRANTPTEFSEFAKKSNKTK